MILNDISNWLEDPHKDHEYKYRVLVYPNITYSADIERDSYVVVIRNALKYLTTEYPNVQWVLLTPTVINSISRIPHTEQRIYPLPSYPNSMRAHFNVPQFLDVINWREEDFDIVYSHLPEHTAQISNVLTNSTNISPKIVGYCHWYEVEENTAYTKNLLHANIAGTLHMEECGVNSEWLKQLVLNRAAIDFSARVVAKLDGIIQPHYLGVDSEEINIPTDRKYSPGAILFNHRPNEYTGWLWFSKAMDKLWEQRQDFKVYTTLAQVDKPWNEKVNLSTRQEYLEFLQNVPMMGVGCFERYSAWSISTTDSLSQGVPCLLPNSLCYPEMVGSAKYNDWLYNSRDEFISKLNALLDNPLLAQNVNRGIPGFTTMVKSMAWEHRVEKWFGGWNHIFDLSDYSMRSKTESYQKIVEFIRKQGFATKQQIIEHMNWGVSIPWGKYRNLLRTEKGVKFTKNGYKWEN